MMRLHPDSGAASTAATNRVRGLVAKVLPYSSTDIASNDKAIAFALTTTSAAATTDAFITVI